MTKAEIFAQDQFRHARAKATIWHEKSGRFITPEEAADICVYLLDLTAARMRMLRR